MSFLDLDERLIELSEHFDLVYSPLVDLKVLPSHVDIALVEGSVSNEDDEHKIKLVRSRVQTLISLGDCAVTGNVPAMRNPFSVDSLFDRAYLENATLQQQRPTTRTRFARPCATHPRSCAGRHLRAWLPAVCGHHIHNIDRIAGWPCARHRRVVALWSLGKDHGKNDHN